jgi:hypothetical protein
LLLFIFCLSPFLSRAQVTYATSQQTGDNGLLCVGCIVNNAPNAADANLQTYSTLNVIVGVAAAVHQDLIFSSQIAANTPVSVKMGSGDNLLDLTVLGRISLQAYNGSTAIGSAIAANTLLSAVSNNNQVELKFAPSAAYDRVRVTLNGGVLGALSSM